IDETINNTPCDFDFTTINENDTLNIACTHDLKGENIFLPSNVVMNYNGGEIINGNLFFEEGGKIDGRLLNHQLEVGGKAKLKSTTFDFEKDKWDMVEGETSDDIALKNKENFQKAINDAKYLGAEVFKMDDLNACFLVTSERNLILAFETSIRIPSDFTLQMTTNTHLRVQPNPHIRYNLLDIREVSNVKVLGGNLIGDRDQHDYTPQIINGIEKKTHEWGHLIDIASGENITIKNVNLSYASGDGINIHSTKHAFDAEYIGSNNITIFDCILDSNRRNNISITDGYNIIVENNRFLNAGIDTKNSKGTSPKAGLDVEAVRKRDADGNLVEYQIAKDIIIRNNEEKGGAGSAFIVAIGQDVTIENNSAENTVSFHLGNGIKIKDNTINTSDDDAAIVGGNHKASETVFNNEISGNTILGGSLGIVLYNRDTKVFNNKIKNCVTGIKISNLRDCDIYDNNITSSKENCYGIYTHVANADNVDIRNNYINIPYKPIAFVNVNIDSGHESNTVTVSNNELHGGKVSISNSNGIILK
ncbi:MAG: hypothetical protein JEZ14_26050, partial [Marinilabiliaceae bacterium]|nr:hypothetical protein [Marinilabiliaceae bacterium]